MKVLNIKKLYTASIILALFTGSSCVSAEPVTDSLSSINNPQIISGHKKNHLKTDNKKQQAKKPGGWSGYFRSPMSKKPWSMILGGALIVFPEHQGSKKPRVLPVPYFELTYKRRVFASTYRGLGVYLYKNKTFQVGGALNYNFRSSRANKNNHDGFAKINNFLSANSFMRWRWRMFAVSARYVKAVSDNYGSTISGSVSVGAPISKYLLLSVGPRIEWSTLQSMRTNYGVSAEESKQSGLPQHNVSAGISEIGLNTMMLMFNGRWFGQALFSCGWDQGDAASSPLTQDKFRYVSVVSLGYRFNF